MNMGSSCTSELCRFTCEITRNCSVFNLYLSSVNVAVVTQVNYSDSHVKLLEKI